MIIKSKISKDVHIHCNEKISLRENQIGKLYEYIHELSVENHQQRFLLEKTTNELTSSLDLVVPVEKLRMINEKMKQGCFCENYKKRLKSYEVRERELMDYIVMLKKYIHGDDYFTFLGMQKKEEE
jgi:hypothetical protein